MADGMIRAWTGEEVAALRFRFRPLSQAKVARGLTRVAAELGLASNDVHHTTVSRWERGVERPNPSSAELLTVYFERLAATLERDLDSVIEEAILKRRQFLKVMGGGLAAVATGGAAAPGVADPAESEGVATGRGSSLGWALGQSIAAAWLLFQTADTRQMLAVGQAQISLLRQHHGALHPSEAACLHSAAHRLMGAIYHRQGRYPEALRTHHQTYLTALEGGDAWNMAETRTWQAYALKALGLHADAGAAIDAALRLISQDRGLAGTRLQAHLLAQQAENAGLIGDARQVDERLHSSEMLLNQLPTLHEEFDRVAWLQSAGNCALYLGQLDLAVSRLQRALTEVPPHWMARRVLTLIALMMALARRRDRDATLTTARSALPLVNAMQAGEMTQHFIGFLRRDLPVNFPNDQRCHDFVAEVEGSLAVDD